MSRTAPVPNAAAQSSAPVGIGWRHPHYAELLQTQPTLDFIEVHSENFFADGGAALSVLEQGRAAYPVSLHGVGLSLGSALAIDPWHLDQLTRLVERIDPVRVSDHACFARAPLAGQPVHASDLLPVPMTQAALHAMCANVQRVQERLRRPIAVENLSAYLRWREADMDEVTFLASLAHRTGCGLLIDVNNLYVNALNAQLRGELQDPLEACQNWLNATDPAQVVELHLAGHVHAGDIVIDDHGCRVMGAVWSLYGHALQRFGAVPTLIEWDTDLPALSVLLDEAQRARDIALSALGQPQTARDGAA